MNTFIERGGGWVTCQGALLLAICGLAFVSHNAWRMDVEGWAGILCFAIGAIVGIAGALTLGGNLTPFPKPLGKARLVTSGIYGWIRHPLYTSVTLLSVGWAFVWHSWPSLIAALLLVPFFTAKAMQEERWLREKFPDYASYTHRTKRFIPWIY